MVGIKMAGKVAAAARSTATAISRGLGLPEAGGHFSLLFSTSVITWRPKSAQKTPSERFLPKPA
jgi:hypothetical protein